MTTGGDADQRNYGIRGQRSRECDFGDTIDHRSSIRNRRLSISCEDRSRTADHVPGFDMTLDVAKSVGGR